MHYFKQSNKGLKSNIKQRDQKYNEKQTEKVVNRYELYLQQKQIIANQSRCASKLIGCFHHIFSQCWNKITSASIRGAQTQRQFFDQSLKKLNNQIDISNFENINKFNNLISQSHCFEQDLVKTRKCLCIIYSQQYLLDLIKQLNQNMLTAIQHNISEGWSINMINIDSKMNEIWHEHMKLLNFNQESQQSENCLEQLTQITSITLNLDSTHVRFKDSSRKCIQNWPTTEPTNSPQIQQIQPSTYPLIIAVYEGMFKQILATKPISFSIQSIETISGIINAKKIFQEQILKKVEANKIQRLQKIVAETESNKVVMDSSHKIQIESTKESC